jgi:hypothetical protein
MPVSEPTFPNNCEHLDLLKPLLRTLLLTLPLSLLVILFGCCIGMARMTFISATPPDLTSSVLAIRVSRMVESPGSMRCRANVSVTRRRSKA